MLLVNHLILCNLLLIYVIAISTANFPDDFNNNTCSPEGLVKCYAEQFRLCASGVWSMEMPLAQGTNCSVFSVGISDLPDSTLQSPTSSSTLSPTSDMVDLTSMTSVFNEPVTAIISTRSGTIDTTSTIFSFETSTRDSSQPAPSQYYSGPASNFPSQNLWLSFDSLWNLNKGVCEHNQNGTSQVIYDDIQTVAVESKVDPRVIFAVILQESTCSLTVGGPGLMQSHNGVSYTDQASILQMIRDGTRGTYYLKGPAGGDGLKQVIDKYGIYGGLRAYNSGDSGLYPKDLNSTGSGGLPSYVSDITNRLRGAKIAH